MRARLPVWLPDPSASGIAYEGSRLRVNWVAVDDVGSQ